MSKNPLNLALRFALELAALAPCVRGVVRPGRSQRVTPPHRTHVLTSTSNTCRRSQAQRFLDTITNDGAKFDGSTVAGSEIDEGGSLDVRAHGESIQVLVDGKVVAPPASGEIAGISVPKDRRSVVRARVDEGYSSPVYVHCGDALRAPP